MGLHDASRKRWLLFDGRACGGVGTEAASVLVSCDSDGEARSYAGDYGQMACYSWLGDLERWEWDWSDDEGFTGPSPGEAS